MTIAPRAGLPTRHSACVGDLLRGYSTRSASTRATPSAKSPGGGQEAQDEVGLGGEVEEVAGVHEDVALLEEARDALLLRERRGHAQDGGPSALGRQDRGGAAGPDGGAQRLAGWSGCARGSGPAAPRRRASSSGAASCTGVETERYVSATTSRRARASRTRPAGPVTAVQASLSWGRPQLFERPPRAKARAGPSRATLATRRGSSRKREVGEDLVRDEGDPALGAEGEERVVLLALQVGARRVVRVHHDDRARARAEGGAQGREVEVPLAVVGEGVGPHPHRLERREELEEGVAGAGHEHLVARVAQQLEEEGVGLAGAGREEHAIGGEREAAAGEVRGHGRARGREAEGRGLVAQGLGAREGARAGRAGR